MAAHLVGGQSAGAVGAVIGIVHFLMHLGGQHHALTAAAALLEPAADDLLGDALVIGGLAVVVRRVEEIDARVQRRVHDAMGFLLVAAVAEGHGAQAELADQQTRSSQMRILHMHPSFRRKIRFIPNERYACLHSFCP